MPECLASSLASLATCYSPACCFYKAQHKVSQVHIHTHTQTSLQVNLQIIQAYLNQRKIFMWPKYKAIWLVKVSLVIKKRKKKISRDKNKINSSPISGMIVISSEVICNHFSPSLSYLLVAVHLVLAAAGSDQSGLFWKVLTCSDILTHKQQVHCFTLLQCNLLYQCSFLNQLCTLSDFAHMRHLQNTSTQRCVWVNASINNSPMAPSFKNCFIMSLHEVYNGIIAAVIMS